MLRDSKSAKKEGSSRVRELLGNPEMNLDGPSLHMRLSVLPCYGIVEL